MRTSDRIVAGGLTSDRTADNRTALRVIVDRLDFNLGGTMNQHAQTWLGRALVLLGAVLVFGSTSPSAS